MTGRHAGGSGQSSRSTPPGAARGAPPGRPKQSRTRRRSPLRWVGRGLGVLLLVAVVATGWLAWSGLRARDELTQAHLATDQLRSALVSGDTAMAQLALDDATAHADTARSLTSGLVWSVAGAVPFLGRTPSAVTAAAADVDAIAEDVLPGLVTVGRGLSPALVRGGNQIDVAALVAVRPSVRRAAAGLVQAEAGLRAIPLDGVFGPVTDAVKTIQVQLRAVADQLDAAATATRLLPDMLGGSTPRRYLVVFQNNAESRATGGLVGAYGVLEATKGQVTVVTLGSDAELRSAAAPVVDLGPAYRQLFGTSSALWPNTNLSAHFPSAAVQQLELWRRQTGQRLDGVIATDPVALGYLLAATGPAVLPTGARITGADIADLTMRQVYATYAAPSQVAQRKAFLQVVAKAALTQVLTGAGSSAAELRALGRAAGERRLLVYSTHPDEEAVLVTTAVGGVVDIEPGPYAALAVDNASGSKIDYYLDRTLAYSLGSCPNSGTLRPSRITVTLHDGAPATGLPAYAAYRLDRGPATSAAGRGGDGSVRDTVLVYAAMGALVTGATLDGAAVPVTPGLDGTSPGRPVFVVSVELAAGQSRTLVLNLVEPESDVAPRGWMQPMARPAVLRMPTVPAESCR